MNGVIYPGNITPRKWIDEMHTNIDKTIQSPTPSIKPFTRQKGGYTGGVRLWKLQQSYHNLLHRSPAASIAMLAMQTAE